MLSRQRLGHLFFTAYAGGSVNTYASRPWVEGALGQLACWNWRLVADVPEDVDRWMVPDAVKSVAEADVAASAATVAASAVIAVAAAAVEVITAAEAAAAVIASPVGKTA